MLTTIAEYEIQRELGRGGMGVVYQCHHPPSKRTVALKLMLQGCGASREVLARFRIEAEALACLDHQNITRILDVGVHDGAPYVVTEFASNGTLGDFATKKNKSIDWCANAVRLAALAVHHANTRWMIHRDLKPTNILIADDESPRVTDFGLVKFTTKVHWVAEASRMPDVDSSFRAFDEFLDRYSRELEFQYRVPASAANTNFDATVTALKQSCLERTGVSSESIDLSTITHFVEQASKNAERRTDPQLDMLTVPGRILGSPQFMSPEQAKGKVDLIGPKTDVYGLGATLYWLLTGEPVHTGNTVGEVLRKIIDVNSIPSPVSKLNPNVSESLDCIVWKAIQRDPQERYENCKVFAEELLCYLNGGKPNALAEYGSPEANQKKNSLRDLFKSTFK